MYARQQTPTSKAEARDGAEKTAVRAMAATATKADEAAKAMAAREKEREKEARERGTRADCMSSI